jgi:hypothetical protein
MSINKQAIKFLETGETPFNDKVICGCNLQEDWSYVFTDGDTIDFQIDATCGESTDTILNGGFEEGSSSTVITDWTRTVTNNEQTTVQRLLDSSSPCGTYLLKFTNVNPTPNLAKVEQTQTFSVGKSYKIKLRAKIETGGDEVANILEIIVGGTSYYITPTTTWEEYELVVNITSSPSNNLFVIKMNQVATDVQALYVDCVEMSEYADCCIFERVNNGCFELGQVGNDSLPSTADNWVLDAMSETGGLNGTRCAIIPGIGDTIDAINVLTDGRNIIRFWAKADADGVTMEVSTKPSNTTVAFLILNSDWTEYVIDIGTNDRDLEFLSTYDEVIYIDCVSVVNIGELNITMVDIIDDDIINIDENVVSVYESYINISIPIDSYEVPSCFKICLDSCYAEVCSEDMKYTSELDACMKELIWYDGEDVAMGINYASGFKNKVRVKAQLQNPTYTLESFVKTTNNTINFISSSKVRKTQELSIDSIPEFLWDRISQCLAISNVEYDGQELAPSTDSNISISYDKNTLLYGGSVTLSPKEEYVVSRTYNCN